MEVKQSHSKQLDSSRSLDRIKGLNDIQHVGDQLAVASSLCDHAHRSDMILRWLLTNLAEDPAYRVLPSSWKLFIKCIRLLQPALLSSRIKASNIFTLINEALQEVSEVLLEDLLRCLQDVLQTLLSIPPQGSSQMGHLLSVDSSTAAGFFAAWSTRVWKLRETLFEEGSAIMDIALRIWDIRRPTALDSEAFEEHCCVPVSLLLTAMDTDSPYLTKRMYDGSTVSSQSVAIQLERLIAKHVFLRSRAECLKQHKNSSVNDSTALIAEQMQRVASAIAKYPEADSPWEVYPTLLNIAIRCGSINTQRQMLQEIAWNDAVFNAILKQCTALTDTARTHTIHDMLSIIQARSTLSLDSLQDLVRTLGGFDAGFESSSWPVIYRVVAMNPRTFLAETLYTPLFEALAREYTIGHERPGAIKQQVVLPIMHAFAQDRRLPDFLNLWQQQLENETNGNTTVWLDLDEALETMLEEHLTPQQVYDLVQVHFDEIATEAGSLREAEQPKLPRRLHALCVVTGAILRGINNTETLDRLEKIATNVYSNLETMCDDPDSPPTQGFWTLARQLFDICAPRSLSNQLDKSSQQQGIFTVYSKLVKTATEQACAQDAPKQSRIALEATMFLGRVCSVHGQHPESKAIVQELLCRLVRRTHADTHVVFIRYPSLLDVLPETEYPRLRDGPKALQDAASSRGSGSGFKRYLSQRSLDAPGGTTMPNGRSQHTALAHLIGKAEVSLSSGQQAMLLEELEELRSDGGDHEHVRTRRLEHTLQVLVTPLTSLEQAAILEAYNVLLRDQRSGPKITILPSLLQADRTSSLPALLLAHASLPLIKKEDLGPSDVADLTAALLQLIESLHSSIDGNAITAAVRCLDYALRNHPYVVNQYMVEETLNAIHRLAGSRKAEVLIFPELCSILTALLKHHRARLNGRFHILIPVLQTLLGRLLAPASRDITVALSARHGLAFTRVLTLFCDPPRIKHRNIKGTSQSSLVDQTRHTRAQVGSFVPVLLHSYCSLVLKASARDGIKESLTPGLWAIMGAMEIHDRDSFKVLGSAMTNSERSVLRGIVDDWKNSTRWSGR